MVLFIPIGAPGVLYVVESMESVESEGMVDEMCLKLWTWSIEDKQQALIKEQGTNHR